MRLILTIEQAAATQQPACRNAQVNGETDYFGCPCFLLFLSWLLMVTIRDCYHKANWIGHPVSVVSGIQLFVGTTVLALLLI